MYIMKNKLSMFLSFLLVMAFVSCENSDFRQLVNDEDILTIVDDEIISLKTQDEFDGDAEASYAMGHKMGFGADRGENGRFSDCASITVSSDDFPKEITIDYGEGCVGKHGDLKTGIIVISMSDTMLNAGAVHEVVFYDVMIGDKSIERTKTMTNMGLNADGNWVLEGASTSTVTYEDGSSSSRESTQSKEWLSGFGTEEREDNVILISGSGSLVNSEGLEFSRSITVPLLVDRSCRYIKSGTILLEKDGEETIIDFGDGECDQWATVTKDGETKEVDLSKKGRGKKGFRGGKKGRG
jgi:hypothetical protein